jgi:acetoin utilization deacetylase AcuC-like enzyme
MTSTAFITHRDCWLHNMGEHHPESPERLAAINDRLIAAGLDMYLSFHDAPLATVEQLSGRIRGSTSRRSWRACPSTASATSTPIPR